MGTRYAAVFFADRRLDLAAVHRDLQRVVDAVDAQMSTWKPYSNLMRLNRAPVGTWFKVPGELATVLAASIEVGRLSGGAFDIGVGDLVSAWGFGPDGNAPNPSSLASVRGKRTPAHTALELDLVGQRVRKHAALTLDLSGIAKGFGVDELARVLNAYGVSSYLVSIDGELRAGQRKPDGSGWQVAIEGPEVGHRQQAGVIEITGGAVATSGDYRHFGEYDGICYSHTMDSRRQKPLQNGPASATVLAATAMRADAWATAMMVIGPRRGIGLAPAMSIEVLFADRRATRSTRLTAMERRNVVAHAQRSTIELGAPLGRYRH
jgi:thiamine biosynthesis lipoprotein